MTNFTTSLHDEKTFYQAFMKDLEASKQEVIIESPFITTERMNQFKPILSRLVERGVKVFIITRDPNEHADGYELQSEAAIRYCEALGVQVLLCTGNHHRKLAIIDRNILWEGSLNILSQHKSREIMRRLEDGGFAEDLFNFLNFGRYI
jgi:phosphatidylserine/phosphatidylglycerophosphate/cardiolipin synthase-like enzyme